MKISTELRILIECIKVSLLENSPETLIFLVQDKKIDWKRLEKMASYHSIRPLVYDALNKINFKSDWVETLKVFTKNQLIMNLYFESEMVLLSKQFQDKSLDFTFFKGKEWQNKFYSGRIRESKDIDLLVSRQNVLAIVEILEKNGYVAKLNGNSNFSIEDYFEECQENGYNEITFWKKKENIYYEIDLHWEVTASYLPFKCSAEEILSFSEFQKDFWIMLLHNGGCEQWSKLKYVADFIVFKKKYEQTEDWELVQKRAIKYKISRNYQFAEKLYLEILLTSNVEISKELCVFWEKSIPFEVNLKSRFRFEKLKIALQDSDFKPLAYFTKVLKFQSIPSRHYDDRVVVFDRKWRFLNLTSKIFTVLIKKI